MDEFYKNKSLLVTGATGFVGKVLVEKLLYSSQVSKIYLLIRRAHGKSAHERLLEMVDKLPFTIRLKRDTCLAKLVAFDCDLTAAGLGLSAAQTELLAADVSVAFHVAASVKFEAPLDVNMKHNVLATQQLLEAARHFKKLECFVHVSTAYSNCQLLDIDERVYPIELPSDLRNFQPTPKLFDKRPNSYTFTKALAENVVSRYSSLMNIAIVRPSIVMSAMSEPSEGWVDTINGPVGLSMLGALGILQKIKVNSEVVFDLIPVDTVANLIICVAWAMVAHKSEFTPGSKSVFDNGTLVSAAASSQSSSASSSPSSDTNNNSTTRKRAQSTEPAQQQVATTATRLPTSEARAGIISNLRNNLRLDTSRNSNKSEKQTESFERKATAVACTNKRANLGPVCVFNLTTGGENPCSFYRYFSVGREEAYAKPSVRTLRPLLSIPKQKGMNQAKYFVYKVFSHLLFAYIVDLLLSLLGHKKMIMKAVNRMHEANEMFDYFCSNQWHFGNENVKKLRQLMSARDKQLFECDVRAIDWNKYARIGWLGCRRFVLKEDDSSFEWAKRRYKLLCVCYYSFKVVLLAICTILTRCLFTSSVASTAFLAPIYVIVYLL